MTIDPERAKHIDPDNVSEDDYQYVTHTGPYAEGFMDKVTRVYPLCEKCKKAPATLEMDFTKPHATIEQFASIVGCSPCIWGLKHSTIPNGVVTPIEYAFTLQKCSVCEQVDLLALPGSNPKCFYCSGEGE